MAGPYVNFYADWQNKSESLTTPITAESLEWIEDGIQDVYDEFTTKGDLVAGTAASTFSRLGVGSNDQVLVADSAQPTGIKWAAVPGTSSFVPYSLADAKGDILAATGADAFAKVTAGANTYILTADSTQASGVKWALDPALDLVEAKGDLLVGTAADTLARLAVGSNNQVLVADSAQATGTKWAYAPGGPTFRAYGSAGQTLTSATATKIMLDAEVWDTHSYFNNTSTYRFTPLQAGYYIVTGCVGWSNMLDGIRIITYLYKSGSPDSFQLLVMGGNNDPRVMATTIMSMNGSTDYIELFARHDRGSNSDTLAGPDSTWLAAAWLRPL